MVMDVFVIWLLAAHGGVLAARRRRLVGAEPKGSKMSEPDRTKLPIRRAPLRRAIVHELHADCRGGLNNRFHVTALCSPTRAALLTGRNSHTVGVGSVGEFAGGFPGYSATLPRDCAPLPRILRDNGYSTAAFGKWHLTPDGQQGPAGPFDRWPNGWGFDYFYGFLGGGASQWDPCLAENQKIIGTAPEYYDKENPYYLPDAMANKTRVLHGSGPRTRTSRSSSTSPPAAATPPITWRRPGLTSTRANSTRAGTSYGRKPSRGRRRSA